MDLQFEVTSQPDDEAVDRIRLGLSAFNASQLGTAERTPLLVVVRDRPGRAVMGGLTGYTAWHWLHVERLWLPDGRRGRGVGESVLARAEVEALRRGCMGAWLDTLNPHASALYQRLGYSVFGTIENFLLGRPRWFVQKQLRNGTA